MMIRMTIRPLAERPFADNFLFHLPRPFDYP